MKTRNYLFALLISIILLGQPVAFAAPCKTPTNFFGTAYGNSIALYWNNADSNAKRFTVYYGTTPGNYSMNGTTPSPVGYTLSNVEKGRTYYFTLTASGNDCTESFRADPISVVGGQTYSNSNTNTTNTSTIVPKKTTPKKVPTSGPETFIPALLAITISTAYFFLKKKNAFVKK